MELLVIPVLLVTGFTLIFLGSHGMPSMPFALHAPHLGSARSERGSALLVAAKPQPASRPAPKFNESDALLGELLTEMSSVKDELNDLRGRIESLSARAAVARAAKRDHPGAKSEPKDQRGQLQDLATHEPIAPAAKKSLSAAKPNRTRRAAAI